jgi:aspartate/methionine/tyrosine aminotransferase
VNPAIAGVAGSQIRALHARKKASSIDLGLGQPTLHAGVAPFERATAWVAEHGCGYSLTLGDLELRERIAAHYAYPWLDSPENVCVTTGSQEALYVTLKTLLDPALDELLIVEPSFLVYGKIARVEGIDARTVALDPENGFDYDAHRILDAVTARTRAIVICSPCNPTGRSISRAAVETISRELAARPGPPVWVIHDEIYRELSYTDDAGSFALHYPYTISINSLSKSNALTGLRLGWLLAPRDALAEISKMHGWATSCASTFAQRVALDIFERDALGEHRAWYANQREGALAAAREFGLDVIPPDGGFYLFANVGGDSQAFAERLLAERDVVTIPGAIFGASGEGWLRTSFVAPLQRVREGLRRIHAAKAELG